MKKLNKEEQAVVKGGVTSTNDRPAVAPIYSSNTIGNISALFSNVL